MTFPAFSEDAVEEIFHNSGDLYVEIIVEESMLYLYENIPDQGLFFLGNYPVSSFKPGLPEYPLGIGFATKVEFNPSWQPTDETVDYMNRKLASSGRKPLYFKGERIKYGDPRNAMGKFKIYLTHSTPKKGAVYRIHGTNEPWSIGKRASGGCTRMDDSKPEVIEFAMKISRALEQGKLVQVNILMRKFS